MKPKSVFEQGAGAHLDCAGRNHPEVQPGRSDRLEVVGVREELEGPRRRLLELLDAFQNMNSHVLVYLYMMFSIDFESAYREHGGLARAVADGVLHDPAAAEDVVQDVFMELWRRPHLYDPSRGSLRSYVALMARSRALDRWRMRAVRQAALERSASAAEVAVPTTESSTHDRVERSDERHALVRTVARLPAEQRDAVLLAFGGGLSAREVASATGVPLGTAKSRIRLGLSRRASTARDRSLSELLSMGQVVALTGVSEATLRQWERRHGFPRPERLPGGHRRFTRRDVELIRRVLAEREAGVSLGAAIERVTLAAEEPEPSVFAGLRRRRPDLQPRALPKRVLIGLSHAIEDESCARAERPVLFASFQRERFYRHAERRWRELAANRGAAPSCSPTSSACAARAAAPSRCHWTSDAAALREWALVCDAPGYAACLAGWERPAPRAEAGPASAPSRRSGAWSRRWCGTPRGSAPSWRAHGCRSWSRRSPTAWRPSPTPRAPSS